MPEHFTRSFADRPPDELCAIEVKKRPKNGDTVVPGRALIRSRKLPHALLRRSGAR